MGTLVKLFAITLISLPFSCTPLPSKLHSPNPPSLVEPEELTAAQQKNFEAMSRGVYFGAEFELKTPTGDKPTLFQFLPVVKKFIRLTKPNTIEVFDKPTFTEKVISIDDLDHLFEPLRHSNRPPVLLTLKDLKGELLLPEWRSQISLTLGVGNYLQIGFGEEEAFRMDLTDDSRDTEPVEFHTTKDTIEGFKEKRPFLNAFLADILLPGYENWPGLTAFDPENGGHIHLDLKSFAQHSLAKDPSIALRNFILDYYAHMDLHLLSMNPVRGSYLSSDALDSKTSLKKVYDILWDPSLTPENGNPFGTIINLRSEALNGKSQKLRGKSLLAFHSELPTIELRSFHPQNSIDQFIGLTKLILYRAAIMPQTPLPYTPLPDETLRLFRLKKSIMPDAIPTPDRIAMEDRFASSVKSYIGGLPRYLSKAEWQALDAYWSKTGLQIPWLSSSLASILDPCKVTTPEITEGP